METTAVAGSVAEPEDCVHVTERGCQQRAERVPLPKKFFSCEDSHSSVLSTVSWLWSSPRFLHIQIIQHCLLYRGYTGARRQDSQKKIVFIHINGKRLDACNVILSVLCGVEIQSTTSSPCPGYLHFCSIYFLFLFLFQLYFYSLGRKRMMRNANPPKTNIVLRETKRKPHKWMSGTVVTNSCCCGKFFFRAN